MTKPFRHSAGFGKRIEYWVVGQMLKEGLDVYVPLVDDFGVDAIIRKDDGTIFEIQIKARSNTVIMGDAALFAALTHEERKNYYFIFYSERMKLHALTDVVSRLRRSFATVQAPLVQNLLRPAFEHIS